MSTKYVINRQFVITLANPLSLEHVSVIQRAYQLICDAGRRGISSHVLASQLSDFDEVVSWLKQYLFDNGTPVAVSSPKWNDALIRYSVGPLEKNRLVSKTGKGVFRAVDLP